MPIGRRDRQEHIAPLGGNRPKGLVVVLLQSAGDPQHRKGPGQVNAKLVGTVPIDRQGFPQPQAVIRRPFPCGRKDPDGDLTPYPCKYNRGREAMAKLNKGAELASKLADNEHVFWSDVNKIFYFPNGKVNYNLMPDLIHPNAVGAEAAAAALEPLLTQLMGAAPVSTADKKESQQSKVVLDPKSLGPIFEGIGAISGGGGRRRGCSSTIRNRSGARFWISCSNPSSALRSST